MPPGRSEFLVVEEDMPAVADAFQMLGELWESTSTIQPEIGVGPPEISTGGNW